MNRTPFPHPSHPAARIGRGLLLIALAPVSLFAGCKLYEPPIYQRLETHPSAQTLKVLFIGNSLTYYNDLAGLVQQFSAREEKPLYIEAVTFPLASLDFHWKSTDARERIERTAWDYVILQQYSTRPAEHPRETVEEYERFARVVAGVGAKPIIFENWSRSGRDGDERKMTDTYQKVHEAIGGTIAPIGHAWRICRDTHPEIDLFEDDRHPTVAGTYLTACVLYRTLYHKQATGLPTALQGLKLSAGIAQTLQQVADQVPIDRPAP
jgi:hypothetical protein